MQGGSYVVLPTPAVEVRESIIKGLPEDDGFLYFYLNDQDVDDYDVALIRPEHVVSVIDLKPVCMCSTYEKCSNCVD
jgi:hypothetical protein